MALSFTDLKILVKRTVAQIGRDDVPSLSAAIAYYTVFSLPPLLVIVVGVAGAVFGPERVQEAVLGEAGGLLGSDGAAAVGTMIENASDLGAGLGTKLVGVAALLFGATGAFGQLQKALNRAWNVPQPEGGGLRGLVTKRLLSFGMVVVIGLLLLVSLVLSAALTALGDTASALVPGGIAGVLVRLGNEVVGLAVIALLFAVLFKVLPDARIAWRDVAVGALVTAVLFVIGKAAIGLYLGQASPGSAFGAAGSLALILVWIYYSALIVLVGAEFTQVWAEREGDGIQPDPEPDVAHPVARPRRPAPY